MIVYKLTDGQMRTYRNYQWTLGKQEQQEFNPHMCAPGGYHAYRSPVLAVLLNYVHAYFDSRTMRLFKARGAGAHKLRSDKCKFEKLTLLEELKLPRVTRARLLAVLKLCGDKRRFSGYNMEDLRNSTACILMDWLRSGALKKTKLVEEAFNGTL